MAEYNRDTIEPLRSTRLEYRLCAVHIAHLLLWLEHDLNLRLPPAVQFNAQATALTALGNRFEAGEAALGRLWIIAEEHSRALAELKTESGNASE
ncbi:MAG TPA: hypothetical protein VF541_13010 [Longimicrobium sp.]|jgi:hypothetical protein